MNNDNNIKFVSTDINDKGLTESEIEKNANRLIAGYVIIVGGLVICWSIAGLRNLRRKRLLPKWFVLKKMRTKKKIVFGKPFARFH